MADNLTITPAPGRVGTLYYMKGDKQQPVACNLDMGDVAAVTEAVANATKHYPTQVLKLAVYRKNGTARHLEETLPVTAPALAGPDYNNEPMAYDTPRRADIGHAGAGDVLPGADFMTNYILGQAHQQLADKESLIIDLRGDKQRLEQSLRDLEKERDTLKFDIAGKDREHQFALKEAIASQPKGLAGIGDVLNQVDPTLMQMFASRFLNVPMPGAAPAQLGAPLAANLTEGQRQVIEALTGWASDSEEQAVKIYGILSTVLMKEGGLDELAELVSHHFQLNRGI